MSMAKKREPGEFFFHDKVVAVEQLPGVPVGTAGKVTLKNGFRWTRYRVYFENGEDIGSIDGSQLMLKKEWERQNA